MTHQHVARTAQSSKSETPLVSALLPRAAVRSIPDTAMQPQEDTENSTRRESRFHHDFSQVPIHSTTPIIQPKLRIGAVGDKYEQEADRVARQVVSGIHAPGNQTVQREAMPDKEDEQSKLMVQRQSDGIGMAATPQLEASIQQARGNGHPLANNIRKPMEQAFGFDFSQVKVHTDAQSERLNRSIQAKAFTTGQDIFFRQGAYSPGSRGGQELIAHELTHVVQQNGRAIQEEQAVKSPQTNKLVTVRGLQQEAVIQCMTFENLKFLYQNKYGLRHLATFLRAQQEQQKGIQSGDAVPLNLSSDTTPDLIYKLMGMPFGKKIDTEEIVAIFEKKVKGFIDKSINRTGKIKEGVTTAKEFCENLVGKSSFLIIEGMKGAQSPRDLDKRDYAGLGKCGDQDVEATQIKKLLTLGQEDITTLRLENQNIWDEALTQFTGEHLTKSVVDLFYEKLEAAISELTICKEQSQKMTSSTARKQEKGKPNYKLPLDATVPTDEELEKLFDDLFANETDQEIEARVQQWAKLPN
ncbi:MAG TPA: DUF4157 domain-containing protein [Waterburya sp.]|jgi:hypothetical protein